MENRLNISKQLEKSVSPDSFIITDSNNESTYLSPVSNGNIECGDSVIVKGSVQNLFGDYMGWGEPEAVQWSTVPLWDNRSWRVWFNNLDTDGLGSTTTLPTISAFTSFNDLISALNTQLATYGSSFRLLGGTTLNRVLVTDLAGNPLLNGDPYFTTFSFNNMEIVIEDSITGSDWLIKGLNPKPITLTGAPFSTNSGYSIKTICVENRPIPTPIIGLGNNFFLQHQRNTLDITTFSNTNFTRSSRREVGTLTQIGSDWANDTLKVTLSYAKNEDYSFFLSNKPMIFLEVLNNYNRVTNRQRNLSMWSHPVNSLGALNRTGSNYGGGDPSSLTTEWDFIPTEEFKDQTIELNFKWFQRSGVTLPYRLVDYVTNGGNQLKYQRGYALVPTGSGDRVINTFQQPIRFRFGYIDPTNNKSVHLGEPSEVLYISPKWGRFDLDDDTYVYDYQIKRKP